MRLANRPGWLWIGLLVVAGGCAGGSEERSDENGGSLLGDGDWTHTGTKGPGESCRVGFGDCLYPLTCWFGTCETHGTYDPNKCSYALPEDSVWNSWIGHFRLNEGNRLIDRGNCLQAGEDTFICTADGFINLAAAPEGAQCASVEQIPGQNYSPEDHTNFCIADGSPIPVGGCAAWLAADGSYTRLVMCGDWTHTSFATYPHSYWHQQADQSQCNGILVLGSLAAEGDCGDGACAVLVGDQPTCIPAGQCLSTDDPVLQDWESKWWGYVLCDANTLQASVVDRCD